MCIGLTLVCGNLRHARNKDLMNAKRTVQVRG
jgi:hypothetical protein